jgi:hypothetical protein
VKSHSYEFQQRILNEPAARVHVEPGNHAELKIRRINIAERLYRITGADIYRDTVLAGLPVPIALPLLNGGVTGQDTNISAPYQGKLFWCYGDTFGLAGAIFSVSCATSELPGKGGLDPAVNCPRSDHEGRGIFPAAGCRIGKETNTTPSSVAWNPYRKKWILLSERTGSVYYSEADQPIGPWTRAAKIVGHNDYNFYNVEQHPFFRRGWRPCDLLRRHLHGGVQ